MSAPSARQLPSYLNADFMLARNALHIVLLTVLTVNLVSLQDVRAHDLPRTDPPADKSGAGLLDEDEQQAEGGLAGEEKPSGLLSPDTVGVASVASGLERSFALADMRIEVSINRRELFVFSGRDTVAVYPVAVGKPEWPTRTGNWGIYEVVWNPWWHPPDEEWAWYRAIMAPGDPDNPLGRAQLIYDAPRSIHGTIEPASIGRAVSHGSIRVTNEVAMKLARHVMESTGVVYSEEWYREVQKDRSRNVRIRLSQRVPIRVYQ